MLIGIKTVIKLEDVHLAQLKNYQAAYNFDIELLLNFGSESLEYKRIYHPRLKNSTHSKILKF